MTAGCAGTAFECQGHGYTLSVDVCFAECMMKKTPKYNYGYGRLVTVSWGVAAATCVQTLPNSHASMEPECQTSTTLPYIREATYRGKNGSWLYDKKKQKFITGPIGSKQLHELPGIGYAYADKLRTYGNCRSAQDVYNKFIQIGQREEDFCSWLKIFGIQGHCAHECYHGLKLWTENRRY